MGKIKITIKEIAKRAETSVSTVSNVMNGKSKCSIETKNRVLKIIEETGYKPNQAARTLVNKKSNLIGLIIFNKNEVLVENKFYQKITNSIIKELSKNNCDLIIGDGRRNIDIVDWISKRDLEGLIIIGHMDLEELKKLESLDLPIVFVDNYEELDLDYNFNSKENYGYVTSDDTIAGFEATEYLLNNGCKNIVFIGDEKEVTHERRYLGYQAALSENFNNIDIKLNCKINYSSGEKMGKKIIQMKNSDKEIDIDGICAASDVIAFGIMNILKSNNINIPKEIKIIGFDNSDYCEYICPKLTSIDLNFSEKGKKAVELIFNQLEKLSKNKSNNTIYLKNILIDLKIIERKSI